MVASFLYHNPCFPGLGGAADIFLNHCCFQIILSLLPKTSSALKLTLSHNKSVTTNHYNSVVQKSESLSFIPWILMPLPSQSWVISIYKQMILLIPLLQFFCSDDLGVTFSHSVLPSTLPWAITASSATSAEAGS